MKQRPVFKLIDITKGNVATIANPVRWNSDTKSYETSAHTEKWYQADATTEAVMVIGVDNSKNLGLIIDKFVPVNEVIEPIKPIEKA